MMLNFQKKRLSNNVFVFSKNGGIVLFNRLNFERKYLKERNLSLSQLLDHAKEMEKNSPLIKFTSPKLKKIRVEVNFSCNLACDYCLVRRNALKRINGLMDSNTAKKIISFYQKNIGENGSVMLCGGEPFLNWKVIDMFISEIHDPIKIFTNGTILDQNILNSLKEKKHVKIMVSLDGKKEDNKYRKTKDGRNSYDSIIKNIKTLQNNNCNVGIAALCLDHNVKRLPEIVEFFADELKIRSLGINFPHYTKEKKLELDMNDYLQGMINVFEIALKKKIYVDQLFKRISPIIDREFRFYSCKMLGEEITFYPNGEKTLCTKIDTLDFSSKNDKKYFQKLIPLHNNFCKDCPAIGICGGGCFWDGMMRFKHGLDERECALNNALLEYFLWKIEDEKIIKIISEILL